MHRVPMLAARLSERMDGLVDSIAAEYRLGFGPDDPLPPSGSLRSSVQAVANLIVSCLSGNRAPREAELDGLRRRGAEARRAGVELHDLLRLLQTASRVVWQTCVEESGTLAGPDERPAAVADGSVLLMDTAAQLSGAASEGYLADVRASAVLEERERQDVVEALLSGHAEPAEAIRRRATAVGVHLGRAHVAVTVAADGIPFDSPDAASLLDEVAEVLLDSGAARAHHPILDRRRDRLEIILAVPEGTGNRVVAAWMRKALSPPLPHGGRLVAGVGRAEHGIPGIRASHRQALAALEVLFTDPGSGPVLTYESALPYAMLRRDPVLAAEVVRATVGPLTDADLLQVLDVYLRTGGNVAGSAKQLQMHRHTLYNRLQRIVELTGRRLEDRESALLFELGLRARAGLLTAAPPDMDIVSAPVRENSDTMAVPPRTEGP